MQRRGEFIGLYFFLLLLSLPIPLMQLPLTHDVIERLRPYIRNGDGTLTPMLMPVPILALRDLGQLSWVLPALIIVCFALAFKFERARDLSTICLLAMGLCGFSNFYALLAVMSLLIQ